MCWRLYGSPTQGLIVKLWGREGERRWSFSRHLLVKEHLFCFVLYYTLKGWIIAYCQTNVYIMLFIYVCTKFYKDPNKNSRKNSHKKRVTSHFLFSAFTLCVLGWTTTTPWKYKEDRVNVMIHSFIFKPTSYPRLCWCLFPAHTWNKP